MYRWAPTRPRSARESGTAGRRAAPPSIRRQHGSKHDQDAWDALTPLVPDPARLVRQRVMTYDPNPEAVPFDTLSTKIMMLMQQNGWRRIAITSPTQACGKTTIAANLALRYSRQREMRTMLLDFDLRRPDLKSVLGQRPAHDLSDLLTGKAAAADCLLRIRDNLAVALQATSIDDPLNIIATAQAATTLAKLQETYDPDLMIFDLSPMMATDSTRAVLRHVDCALIVVRADQSTVSQLDSCEREVAEYTDVLGVVLNSCRYLSTEERNDDPY